jgi:hypothetical protein
MAIAPRLIGYPTQHILCIAIIILGPLLGMDTVRISCATNIDPKAGVSVPRQIAVVGFVARCTVVTAAVWDVLQDRRNPIILGNIRQP